MYSLALRVARLMDTSCLPYSDYSAGYIMVMVRGQTITHTDTCDNTYKGNAVLVDPVLQVF